MTEIAQRENNTLALAPDASWWTDKQLAILRQLGVDRATNADLAVFHHVCQRTGLDPFARQIYMIQRDGKQVIQTGIDGFRLVARRAADHAGQSLAIGESQWCDRDGRWSDVWLSDEPPAAARVVVERDGKPFPGTALFREYVQRKRDGNVTQMWVTRPAGQLAKCAEALALRKAFPQDLSGIYTDDELGQRDVVSGSVVQQADRPGLASALRRDEPVIEDAPASVDTTTGEVQDAEVVEDYDPTLDPSWADQ